MRKGKKIAIVLGMAVAGFLSAAYLLPVTLVVDVSPEKVFRYESIQKEDVTVYPSPLFVKGKTSVSSFVFNKEEKGGDKDLVITWGLLQKRMHMQSEDVASLKAIYDGSVQDGDALDKNRIRVIAAFADGREERIGRFEVVGNAETMTRGKKIGVRTRFGVTELLFDYSPLKDIQAAYSEAAYEGAPFNADLVTVDLVYENGATEKAGNVVCEGPAHFTGVSSYAVYTAKGSTQLDITPIRIKYAVAESVAYAGDVFNGRIRIVYENGVDKLIDSSDVTFETSAPLSPGRNTLGFTWHGTHLMLTVQAKETNSVSDVQIANSEEAASSIYYSFSDRLYVSVRKIEDGRSYYLTHVAINEPSQIQVVPANGLFGSGLEMPQQAALRTGWALGINGGFYRSADGIPLSDCVIRAGQVLSAGTTTGQEICLTNDGALFSPPAGLSAQELLMSGVRDVLATTGPLILQDGVPYTEGSMDVAGRFPRTAIGMVRPGEYYLVTSEGEGLYCSEMQQIFTDLGCRFARSLDGGSAVALYYGQQPVTGLTSRASSEFVGFFS